MDNNFSLIPLILLIYSIYFSSICRVIENGIETVTIIENGELISRTVNGVPASIK